VQVNFRARSSVVEHRVHIAGVAGSNPAEPKVLLRKIEMDFYEIIKNYPKQFEYDPEIIGEIPKDIKYFIISGMGGSHLAADILENFFNNIFVHSNYKLPNLHEEILKKSLIITLSHSGNTEETIDSFETARKRKLKIIAISTGNKLIELAKKHKITYIQLPKKNIPPRLSLGYHTMALLKIIDVNNVITNSFKKLSKTLEINKLEKLAIKIYPKLKNKIPIIYSSEKNKFLAYNFKIKFNETSKIPSFYNFFPELNHNEIEMLEYKKQPFIFIFLYDKKDHLRIQKRMIITEKIFKKKKMDIIKIKINTNKGRGHEIFSMLILGDFISYYLAKFYKRDPEKVKIIEQFKEIMKNV
jgi:glucose/mannose-6-phosphate isomerase